MRYILLLVVLMCCGNAWGVHPNDYCTGPIPLTAPASGVVNTAGASTDSPPVCSPAVPQNGIWFTTTGTGNTLRFSTCDMSGTGAHALQVFRGDCGDLVCVGGNKESFCAISGGRADVTWCAESGVQYYILLGSESGGDITADYFFLSLGACNYVGGNCVPEVVFAPAEINGTAHNRDDCCFSDAADQHFLVYLPYASNWKFLACGGTQPHQFIGTTFCGNDICEESDNLFDEEPGCMFGSRCDCMPLGPGYVHIAVETDFDDGEGDAFQYKIRDCNSNNGLPPVDLDPYDVSSACELVFGGGYRIVRVFGADLNPARPPILSVSEGCETCNENISPPAAATYDPNGWVLHPPSPNIAGQEQPYWQNVILGQGQGYVCIRLEGFLPVELLNFAAIAADREVRLHWITGSEEDLDRFVIERDGQELASVRAANSASGESYTYVDRNVANDVAYGYSLFAVNLNGEREHLADAEATPRAGAGVVEGFALAQNYPNPFNPETTIDYSLSETGLVRLAVFDLNGREVMTLVNGTQNDGRHTVKFDAASLSSGIYFYQLEHNGLKLAKKMMLLK